jgi:glycosyltransferase involved in cell wall biosynthesis
MSDLKKVLWVTSFFPPRVNVATNRTIKFLKYLPHFGWKILVASPKEFHGHTRASQRLMNQLNSNVTILPMPPDLFHFVHDRAGVSGTARYFGYLINNIIPPDGHLFWSLSALRGISKAIRNYKPDIVYTTCSPFSINLIGTWAKFKYDIPWVTDFRDLWTLNPMPRKSGLYGHIVSNIFERLYLRYCDALIVNTGNSKSRMIGKYPFLKEKIWVIPNGFDPEDIHSNNHGIIPNSFFYSGLIDPINDYTPLPVLKLLSKLHVEGFLNVPIELHYAGNEGEEFLDLCNQAGINGNRKTYGYLAHESFYDLIQSMMYVIMCMPCGVDTSSWIPARFYDYIGNKSRIICLAPKVSEVARSIEQYGNGITLFYDEPEDIQIGKLQKFLATRKNDTTVPTEFIERFSRKNLALCLSKVFQHIISG